MSDVMLSPPRQRSGRSMRRTVVRLATMAGFGVAALAASAAPAAADGYGWFDPTQFGIDTFTTAATGYSAGGHADVTTDIEFKARNDPDGRLAPFGRPRRIEVDMPIGLVGNPTNFPSCSEKVFRTFSFAPCPADTQVGMAKVTVNGAVIGNDSPIYNLAHGPDEPALLGVKVSTVLHSYIRIKVRPDGGLTAIVDEIPLGQPLLTSRLTLWGVPADHNGSGAPRVPFMSGPTNCDGIPTTRLRAYSYEGESDSAVSQLERGLTGCGQLPFNPKMTAQPTTRSAAATTGVAVQIKVPQNNLPDGHVTAHVKQVRIQMPQGMSVSPSSANGLAACAPADFGYGTDAVVTCPDAAKLGSVTIDTPLLDQPMQGSVYLAKQNDNPFNSLLALYLVAQGQGVTIKLAGRVDPDPATGQLTATFENNPQLPFSQLDLVLKSGPRAPLVNSQTCGDYQSTTTITSWDGQTVTGTTPWTVDQDCQPVGFSPSFSAGTVSPVGGAPSTFSLTFGRGDHDQELKDITVAMPEGLTGKIATTELCAEAAASAGACGDASQVGTVTTAAGPGSDPYYLPGKAYLTGAYKDAPLGLEFVVPAVAGPFDLGNVVVRAGIYVDRNNASLRVVSDPLPRILQGIPLQIRTVNVAIDKQGFMINPTSCAVKQINGHITSQQGAASDVSNRFQVGDCGQRQVAPKMTLTVGSRGHTAARRTTPLVARLTQTDGQSNLKDVKVKLPRTLNSRLEVVNLERSCSMEQYQTNKCPMSIGTAEAATPLLRDPLKGNVYLVRGSHRLPDMMVKLQGTGETPGIAIDLVGFITIPRDLSLQTEFPAVPDVPITSFTLSLVSGRNGAIGVVRNLCSAAGRAGRSALSFRGQNGRLVTRTQRLSIRGCAAARKPARKHARRHSKKAARKHGKQHATSHAKRGASKKGTR